MRNVVGHTRDDSGPQHIQGRHVPIEPRLKLVCKVLRSTWKNVFNDRSRCHMNRILYLTASNTHQRVDAACMCASNDLVVDVCDVLDQRHVVSEVPGQNAADDIEAHVHA